MLTEQILFMVLVAIFSLLLHYYIGVINIWYFPCTEVLVGLLLYEIMVSMYKSYAVYSEHLEMQNNARESEILSFDKITKLNTKINESTSIEKDLNDVSDSRRTSGKTGKTGKTGTSGTSGTSGTNGTGDTTGTSGKTGKTGTSHVNRVNHNNQEKKSHQKNNDKKISFDTKEDVVSFPEVEGQNIIKVIEGDQESVSESEISE